MPYTKQSTRYTFLLAVLLLVFSRAAFAQHNITVSTDPVTRYIHIEYPVPADAPDEIWVACSWSPSGKAQWQKAAVFPLISETGWFMLDPAEWNTWRQNGTVIEQGAAGLTRTIVFNPYPDAQINGIVNVDFKIIVTDSEGAQVAAWQIPIHADNSDVVYIEDWSRCFQKNAIVTDRTAAPAERKWSFQTNLDKSECTFGNQLFGQSTLADGLVDLTYPLNLKGSYAIYVSAHGSVHLRLTGDLYTLPMDEVLPGKERLWKWTSMDHQHLVVHQHHGFTGWQPTSVDYVKLVPLTADQVAQLEAPYQFEHDKLVTCYWEPYSWSFYYGCDEPQDHSKPLLAFKDAKVDILDIQLGRFGMKSVYESRIMDQLVYDTHGDPVGDVDRPITSNVGMMQQYTNTLETELQYCRQMGLAMYANFGISNCYPKTSLQGDFSKQHPEWMRKNLLKFEIPQVRQFALDVFQECMEIGADRLAIDFCRYAGAIDKPETANIFLRDLKQLRDNWQQQHGKTIKLLARIPVIDFKDGWRFDFATWPKNGWVDILVPSGEAERFYNFDITPYLNAVAGTQCKLIPRVGYDQRELGLALARTRQLYKMGADGVYFYQGSVPDTVEDIRNLPLFGSSQGIEQWFKTNAQNRSKYSKRIYVHPTSTVRHRYWKQNRIRVWLDGIEFGPVKLYLDGKLISSYDQPPYTLGRESHDDDKLITPGEHRLRVQAKDGDRWIEQTFILPKQK